ncbi:MAG: hypothetical protein K2Y51_09970 [Gammaproteobacteria bacterium]|nr:hypothetical protein [Gammaproteobacteria bacterium]
MSYTVSESRSSTYTLTDIETVIRRFTADIVMIAQSTGAITEAEARDYAHDVEALAKAGYLKTVDLTLFCGADEIRATQYVVATSAGDLKMSRPGGVMWPRVPDSYLRIVLSYTDTYIPAARETMKRKLQLLINWMPTDADTSHSRLTPSGGRSYTSNGWGIQRRDYAA